MGEGNITSSAGCNWFRSSSVRNPPMFRLLPLGKGNLAAFVAGPQDKLLPSNKGSGCRDSIFPLPVLRAVLFMSEPPCGSAKKA
jgi:hypothetical protein